MTFHLGLKISWRYMLKLFVNEVIKCLEILLKKKIELEGGALDIDESRLAKH